MTLFADAPLIGFDVFARAVALFFWLASLVSLPVLVFVALVTNSRTLILYVIVVLVFLSAAFQPWRDFRPPMPNANGYLASDIAANHPIFRNAAIAWTAEVVFAIGSLLLIVVRRGRAAAVRHASVRSAQHAETPITSHRVWVAVHRAFLVAVLLASLLVLLLAIVASS